MNATKTLSPVSGAERTVWAMRGWLSFKPYGWATEKDFVHKKAHPKKGTNGKKCAF